MKKFLSFILGVAVAASASFAQADVIAFDNFDYADGSLVPNGGWANHSGTADTLLVSGGQVIVLDDGSTAEDANIGFTGVAGDIFYGLDFSVDDLGTPYSGVDNEYFAHFKSAGGFAFSARMDIVAAQAAGDFSVGIASDESTADVVWGSDLTFGTTYRAIVRYNQDSNIAELWIDATSQGDLSILGEDRDDPGDVVGEFALRQASSSVGETIRVDGLVIGSTFSDVVTAVAVPEPGVLGFLAVGMIGMIARRRRS